ncbi:MAG: LacI family DNA-binding transcriptional regulator [Puniceicoccales bacterium]
MSEKRITQQDIARKAGVHRATVSMALKHHPRIPAATRERILQLAEELGYRPDPMLSALATYRSGQQKHTYQGTLAWLVVHREDIDLKWREIDTYRLYYEGAQRRADKYGYKVEVFELGHNKLSPKRLASMLKARNINGILLCPQPNPWVSMDFPWSDFSLITFGYTLLKPKLHTVTSTQYRAMVQTMTEMHKAGYRRIAFVFDFAQDAKADHNFLAGYLVAQQQIGQPPMLIDYQWRDLKGFKERIEGMRPEAIVTGDFKIHQRTAEIGIRIPEDLPVACVALNSLDSELTGICENSFHIGEIAVERLANMIAHGERGVPELVQRTHIEGQWVPGNTLPELSPPS